MSSSRISSAISNLLNGRVTAIEDDTVTVALDVGAMIAVPRRGKQTPGSRVAVVLRPEDITVHTSGAAMPGRLSGQVAEIGYQGDSCRLSVAVGGEAIKVKVPPRLALALQPGSAVELSWERGAARLLSLDDRKTA